MIDMLDKGHMIKLVESGLSYREVSKKTGVHRKTVAKYHKEHKKLMKKLKAEDCPNIIRDIQNEIVSKPVYP